MNSYNFLFLKLWKNIHKKVCSILYTFCDGIYLLRDIFVYIFSKSCFILMEELEEERDRERIERMLNLYSFTYTLTEEEKRERIDEAKATYFDKYGVHLD